MGPNTESSNSRLSYLENIHADLVEKVSALARLQNRSSGKRLLFTQRLLIKNNAGTWGGPGRPLPHTVKPGSLVEVASDPHAG